ncbi:hypothetical protein SD71_21170 [Cohnella kolymensis]|uniref:Methyltransferase type 11 domain-containing protein n=1 Tax=Cohnella kolymensis TaxID=1590652 RepID=A0ABR5A0U6_9BACL|nr:class I SAM-dependent methyltransferase [Cohnella kolymensis]KIL34180.1 hypothetical protein SD71_21170 [Cohnella kolymensis]
MLRNDDIYEHIATPYDLLISKEDYMNNISAALLDIAEFNHKDVADLGAGTGRLSCMVAPLCKSIVALDFAADMLKLTASKLSQMKLTNWKTTVADLRQLPLEDQSMDIVMAGWSICYLASSNNEDWSDNLTRVLNEVNRVLKPNGTVIVLETLGTGNERPEPPDFLQSYFTRLEQDFGFKHKAIRTDYQFDSVEQAEALCRDFFGDSLGDWISKTKTATIPECTGIWWRTQD